MTDGRRKRRVVLIRRSGRRKTQGEKKKAEVRQGRDETVVRWPGNHVGGIIGRGWGRGLRERSWRMKGGRLVVDVNGHGDDVRGWACGAMGMRKGGGAKEAREGGGRRREKKAREVACGVDDTNMFNQSGPHSNGSRSHEGRAQGRHHTVTSRGTARGARLRPSDLLAPGEHVSEPAPSGRRSALLCSGSPLLRLCPRAPCR